MKIDNEQFAQAAERIRAAFDGARAQAEIMERLDAKQPKTLEFVARHTAGFGDKSGAVMLHLVVILEQLYRTLSVAPLRPVTGAELQSSYARNRDLLKDFDGDIGASGYSSEEFQQFMSGVTPQPAVAAGLYGILLVMYEQIHGREIPFDVAVSLFGMIASLVECFDGACVYGAGE